MSPQWHTPTLCLKNSYELENSKTTKNNRPNLKVKIWYGGGT